MNEDDLKKLSDKLSQYNPYDMIAVPLDAYESFFQLPFGQLALQHFNLSLIVYSIKHEEITAWKK